MNKYLKYGLMVALSTIVTMANSQTSKTEMGVNVNKALWRINPNTYKLMDAVNAKWYRGMFFLLEYYDKYKKGEDWYTSSYLANFIQAKRDNPHYKMVLSIYWSFADKNMKLPAPGSTQMNDYKRFLQEVLNYVGHDIDKLVISNEPMWNTLASDRVTNQDTGINPSVEFHKQVAQVISEWKQNNNGDLDIYVGALNALHKAENRDADDVVGMIKFANTTPWIKGIDIHPHTRNMEDLESIMFEAREMLNSDKDIIMTEYSLVWRWAQHLKNKLPEAFATQYNYPMEYTFKNYLEKAQRKRVSKKEWNDLFSQLDWWIPHFPEYVYKWCQQYGVSVTNYAFGSNMPLLNQELPIDDGAPFFLNQLYQGRFIKPTADGLSKHAFIWQSFKQANATN